MSKHRRNRIMELHCQKCGTKCIFFMGYMKKYNFCVTPKCNHMIGCFTGALRCGIIKLKVQVLYLHPLKHALLNVQFNPHNVDSQCVSASSPRAENAVQLIGCHCLACAYFTCRDKVCILDY